MGKGGGGRSVVLGVRGAGRGVPLPLCRYSWGGAEPVLPPRGGPEGRTVQPGPGERGPTAPPPPERHKQPFSEGPAFPRGDHVHKEFEASAGSEVRVGRGSVREEATQPRPAKRTGGWSEGPAVKRREVQKEVRGERDAREELEESGAGGGVGTRVGGEARVGEGVRSGGSTSKLAQRALEIASCSDARVAAGQRFLEGFQAASTTRGEASKLETMARVAEAAGFDNMFPLNADLLTPVLGALKAAGYKSASS